MPFIRVAATLLRSRFLYCCLSIILGYYSIVLNYFPLFSWITRFISAESLSFSNPCPVYLKLLKNSLTCKLSGGSSSMIRLTLGVLCKMNVSFWYWDITPSDQFYTCWVLLLRSLSCCSSDHGGSKPDSIILMKSCRPSLSIASMVFDERSSIIAEIIIEFSKLKMSVQNLKLVVQSERSVKRVFCGNSPI